MQDLLVVWDAIFADGISFDLVDYVFVAMLLYIRDFRECACVCVRYACDFVCLVLCCFTHGVRFSQWACVEDRYACDSQSYLAVHSSYRR